MKNRKESILVVLSLCTVVGTGCVQLRQAGMSSPRHTISSSEKTTIVRDDVVRSALGPAVLHVNDRQSDERVEVAVQRELLCWNSPETVIRTESDVEYRTNWWFTGPLIGASAALLGTGIYGMAVANRHPRLMDPGSRGELAREAVWTSSITAVLAGLAGGTWAAWGIWTDGRKGTQSDESTETRDSELWACGREAVPSQSVTLTLHDGRFFDGITDSNGVVAWSIATRDLPPAPEGQPFGVATVIPGGRAELEPGVIAAPALTGRVIEASAMPVPSRSQSIETVQPVASVETVEAESPHELDPAPEKQQWLMPPTVKGDGALSERLEGTVALPPRAVELVRGDLAGYYERPELARPPARTAFESTPEGKALRQQFDERRSELLGSTVAMATKIKIRRYNVLKRALELELGSSEAASVEQGRPLGALGNLLPDNLSVERVPQTGKKPVAHDERVTFKVDPRVGTTLYSRKDNVTVWIRFRPRGARKVDVSMHVKSRRRAKVRKSKQWVIEGSAVELIAVDSESSEVLWVHSFEQPGSRS